MLLGEIVVLKRDGSRGDSLELNSDKASYIIGR
jgi:hypothetical protein